MSENIQDQEEELTALEAIFEDDFTLLDSGSGDKHFLVNARVKYPEDVDEVTVQAWIRAETAESGAKAAESDGGSSLGDKSVIPSPGIVKMERSQSQNHWQIQKNVRCLPGLLFDCRFPPGYPSSATPDFKLSCSWLSCEQLTRVCRHLDKLWDEAPGMPIVYAWVDWLQHSLMECLAVAEGITLQDEEEVLPGFDPRIDVRQCTSSAQDRLFEILQHDFDQTKVQFQTECHTCEICFEEKDGKEFIFLECGHVFCNDCLRAFCELHTQDGSVESLACPNSECNISLSPFVMREILNPEHYQRWEQFVFQKSLDRMLDVVYCPRCNTPVICENSGDTNLGHCAACYFAFCTECLESWHQGVPCHYQHTATDQSKGQASKRPTGFKGNNIWTSGKGLSKGETKIQDSKLFILTQLSYGKFKKCPKCKIVIEKNMGCSHMCCSRCGCDFCWTCGKPLKDGDYSHNHQDSREMLQIMKNQPVSEGRIRVEMLEGKRYDRNEFINCPTCAQKNARENKNNHLRCWNCKTNFCFQCKKVITGNVSAHFIGPCKQHSD